MTLKEIFKQQPLESDIKSNEDGSVFIPIGIVQNKLDDLPNCTWFFEINHNITIGEKTISGVGVLTVMELNGDTFIRSGSATLDVSIDVKGSVPWLESEIQKNAAKKLGPWFGRDLNRDNNDFQTAKLPVIKKGGDITDTEDDAEISSRYEDMKRIINGAGNRAEALSILMQSQFKFNNELKLLAQSKPE